MTPVADMVKSFAARHAMVSFEHPEQIEACAEICQSIVLDNGAFSAWKSLNGSQSVPVYHMHESLDRLEMLVRNFPRVALGSSGEFAKIGTDLWWTRMAEMMDVACDVEGFPRSKLHGLRMLDPGVFSRLPLSSADSCNVARNVGFDSRWKGTYIPKSRAVRALILMDRIERHASSAFWSRPAISEYQNMDLFG
jgi:hypothetical protein